MKVLVGSGEKTYLKKEFNVSYKTIRKALNGVTTHEVAQLIRERAIERGGIVQEIDNKQK